MERKMKTTKSKNAADAGTNNGKSYNDIDVIFFKQRLLTLRMGIKDFAEIMNRNHFKWDKQVVYRILNENRIVSIKESLAMCKILGCKIEELFSTTWTESIQTTNYESTTV